MKSRMYYKGSLVPAKPTEMLKLISSNGITLKLNGYTFDSSDSNELYHLVSNFYEKYR